MDTRAININIASREELGNQLGLGPDLSEAIIIYREAYGPFRIWDNLTSIDGVTDNLIREMKKSGARL